ncbi:serine hydrolase domain-containing protein [Pseudomonas mangrovi]|uniref:6-aminohexanoate hydrolase n=1 Tax=Pseudomonas mangrovi TaxID=2161748 RepID=A0A2T5P9V1_9PSED|nr:serine hydrolase [Pseudomonas mangrovi]PTU74471.1 6-aminohexanoate hydrolase [Pseudomonas mangrovi]
MKLLPCVALFGLCLAHSAHAQPPSLPDPTSVRLDRLQLMQGFPPAADRRVTAGSYMRQYPQARWAFHHMRELLPSRSIPRGAGPASPLPAGADRSAEIEALRFNGASGELSFAEYLKNTYTDGVIVLLEGKVVYQRYFGMPEEQPHIMWSMTKSMIGLIATQLIHEGKLDAEALVTDYLPELADSGWKGATVQQVLNMTADVSYSEVYADAESDVVKYAMAAGMSPVPADYPGARSLYDYLPSIPGKGNHGREFQYRTVHTEVLGWILRRVTGQDSAQMIGERIWSPLGTEHEAYMLLDPAGTEWAGAGMNASLRDLARFGEMLRNDGAFNGRQIVAPQVLASIREGADRELFKASGRIGQDGYSYRNQFWISHNRDGAFELLGVHGQMIHVNPAAGLVLVRLSSHPVAASAAHFPTTRPAMAALAELLRTKR